MRHAGRVGCCCRWIGALVLLQCLHAMAADGETVYRATCSTCHESGAGGAPRTGHAEEWKDRFSYGRAALQASGLGGVPGTAMAPKGGFNQLTADEVKAAVDYMLGRSAYADPAVIRARGVAATDMSTSTAIADTVVTARVAASLRSRLARLDAPIDAEGPDLIVRGVGIRVGTASGVVRMMGVVQDAELAKRAEAVVRSVEGVRGVDNRLVSGGMLDFD